MDSKELERFEREAEDAIRHTGSAFPVSETKSLSPKVLEILVENARTVGDMKYSSSGSDYTVSFAYIELKEPDGRVGVYDELPDDLDMAKAETVAFLVRGFHKNEPTEVQFYKGKIELNRSREFKHLINFQRAVLMKGA